MSFPFIEINPFNPATVAEAQRTAPVIPVRRPLLGLSANEETHATLQILTPSVSGDGSTVVWQDLLNSSAEGGTAQGTSNFTITSVRHARAEKFQLVETFSDPYLYLYGERPKFIDVQGVLLKSKNFAWRTEWLKNYDTRMRASRTVDSAAKIYLTVEDTIYEGHMLGCEVVDQANEPLMAAMTFTMYLTNVIYGLSVENLDNSLTDADESFVSDSEILNRGEIRQNLGTKSSGVEGTFTTDANGVIRLVSVGGLTSRRNTGQQAFNRAYYEQLAAEVARMNALTGSTIDPDLIRAAGLAIEAARLSYGFGDGDLMGRDGQHLARLFDSDVGGYATQVSDSVDALAELFSDIGDAADSP